MGTAVVCAAAWRNSSSTPSTSLRVICFRLAMAPPICCTSRAERNLNTSAAASSPRDMTRIAQRSISESTIGIFLFHPGSQYHRNGARVFLSHGARGVQVFFIAVHFRSQALRRRHAFAVFLFFLGQYFALFFGVFRVGHERLDHGAPQDVDNQRNQQVLNQLHRVRSEEHTSELQSLMRISYAVFCLKQKNKLTRIHTL